ncbi:MAG: hypothetical protein ACYCWK_04505 [Cuniculiplasma sp.]
MDDQKLLNLGIILTGLGIILLPAGYLIISFLVSIGITPWTAFNIGLILIPVFGILFAGVIMIFRAKFFVKPGR